LGVYTYLKKYLFKLDPETAHHYLLKTLPFLMPTALVKRRINRMPTHPVSCFGITFPNPIGLAAGFDKDGLCIDQWFGLGFGFVELGTVTPRPQSGNSKPRLFRIEQAQAIINRMGFNNLGVDHLVTRLKARTMPGVVGVNIGKNRDTPLDHAFQDYCYCLERVYPYCDYVTINISSPNTPALRDLQTQTHFNALLQAIRDKDSQLADEHGKATPLLVKVCPDMDQEQLAFILSACIEHDIDGVIINNTSVNHEAVLQYKHGHEQGGLSGRPIREISLYQLKRAKQIGQDKLPIISVGGIMSVNDATARFEQGASLIQLYSGFVYEGPSLLRHILSALRFHGV